nr:Laglidadg [Balamuthia mandrillaris]AKT94938.1 Laglidadg [Balamuthia mandrillaris]AKT94966.1 Laglidadg [Balamuthia mandrillaris]AKT95005.1 Laglidadg [Balamuthia mandrillaris]
MLLYPDKVKILLTANNQQETNGNPFQVGSSETLRPLSSPLLINSSPDAWDEWLAGLIDGDGSLLVSKSGYTSCEITMGIEDAHALAIIKQKLGGSVKLRSGVKALRYRLHHNSGMLELIRRINGKIRHTSRLKQLEAVCLALKIPIKYPLILTKDNGWFSGFFDADGTITYSMKNTYPQLTVSVTNKLRTDVICFKDIFGGNVYYDKGQYGYYKWSIQSRGDIEKFQAYLKTYPCLSNKKQRVSLINLYYVLSDLEAYSAALGSPLAKAWARFNEKWHKRG